jgi:hypothetical protein
MPVAARITGKPEVEPQLAINSPMYVSRLNLLDLILGDFAPFDIEG